MATRWRNRLPTFRDIARPLAEYVRDEGFTHVELMPITEHPFYGSWGYQTTGYFAPSARYGTPQDFMKLVDTLHQCGIGVILDWVPSHFPTDAHGLAYFDGTHLYEHADPRQGFHPEWKTFIFNYGGTKFAPSCCRAPCSGSTGIISMGCAWTPSRRCFISTTDAGTANGFPTSTAVEKTWVLSGSCARSTRPYIGTIRMRR